MDGLGIEKTPKNRLSCNYFVPDDELEVFMLLLSKWPRHTR